MERTELSRDATRLLRDVQYLGRGEERHSTPFYSVPEFRAREGLQETFSKPCSVLLTFPDPVLETEFPSLALFHHPGATSSAHAAALPRDKASDTRRSPTTHRGPSPTL